MNSFKKKQLKDWAKKKKVWLIGTGGFLIIGTVLLIVGFSVSGFNIIDWLNSPYFPTCIAVLAVAALVIMYVVIDLVRAHLGGDDNDR